MIKLVLKYRLPLIIILVVISALAATQIKKMGKDVSVNSMLPTGNTDFIFAEKMRELFGSTDQFVIGIHFKDSIYTVANLTLIKELSDFMENLPQINKDDVKSIFAVKDIEGKDNELIVAKILDEDSVIDPAVIKMVQTRIRSNPLFRGRMVSKDEHSAVVTAAVDSKLSESSEAEVLLDQIKAKIALLQKQNPTAKIYISGIPVILVNKSHSMEKDLKTLFPLVLLLVMLILYLLLKKISGLILPLLITFFSVVWTYGLKGVLGSPLTMSETIIPVMLIAIGCADGIHIINEFYLYRRQGLNSREAIVHTMNILTLPIILTSVTTALGFASLLTSQGASLKNMGLFMSFGVMVAMVFSLCFIPAVLSMLGDRPVAASQTPLLNEFGRFSSFLRHMGKNIINQRYFFLALTFLILAVSILGVVFMKVEGSDLHYLKKTHPLYIATKSLEKYLGGVVNLELIVSGKRENFIAEPRIQKAIWELQKFCERQNSVSYSLSIVDQVKRINYVLHGNDPKFDRIPNETELVDGQKVSGMKQIAQFLLLYEMGGGKDLEKYADGRFQTARILLRLNDMSTHTVDQLLKKINPYLASHFPTDAQVRYAGYYKNYIAMKTMVASQLWSLLTTLLTISVLLMFIYRSIVNGLLVVIPTFITVLFNFAVMWIFGIALNPATAIIASVGMGVGIDYGIHYFARFRECIRAGKEYQAALITAIAYSGEAIIFNAVAVGGGFLVLLFSDYHAIASMGWITSFAMVTTALSSLVLLPAMLAVFQPKLKVKRRASHDSSSSL
jgi:predicted RND superfamily exporter protein